MSAAFDAVLFDLGGVLVELGGAERQGVLVGTYDPDEIAAIWHTCPVLRDYETGRISTQAFAAGMIDSRGLDISAEAFLAAYRDWAVGLYPGARQLLADLCPDVRVGCLSNIGEFHWQTQNEAFGFDDMFDVCLASFELGVMKPDPAVYEIAIGAFDCEAGRIAFLDDNHINVSAAEAAGMAAREVKGVTQARRTLQSLSLLGP